MVAREYVVDRERIPCYALMNESGEWVLPCVEVEFVERLRQGGVEAETDRVSVDELLIPCIDRNDVDLDAGFMGIK